MFGWHPDEVVLGVGGLGGGVDGGVCGVVGGGVGGRGRGRCRIRGGCVLAVRLIAVAGVLGVGVGVGGDLG